MSHAQGSGPDFSHAERLRHLDILKFGSAARPKARRGLDAPSSPERVGKGSVLHPRLAADTTLTALAQLAALRMRCRWAFICLTDPKDQHILAVATRSISPFDVTVHAPGDALALGVGTVARDEYGLSLLTLPAFIGESDHWVHNDNRVADASRYIIADLQAEPEWADKICLPLPHVPRLYVEVPLTNQKDRVVGSVVVIDDTPTSNITLLDVRPMQDVAHMVMDHFELVRLRDINMRAERLIQGLAHFNAGESSISQWVMDNPSHVLSDDVENHRIQTHQRVTSPVEQGSDANSPSRSSLRPQTRSPEPDTASGRDGQLRPAQNAPDKSVLTSVQRPDGSADDSMALLRHDPQATVVKPARASVEPQPGDPGSRNEAIKDAFARASNIIRESMDLEAACFLELASDGGPSMRRSRSPSKTAPSEHSDSEAGKSDVAVSGHTSMDDHPAPDQELKYAVRLGFSALTKSSVVGDQVGRAIMTLPEKDLAKLVTAFPRGSIFNFDAVGALSSGDDARPNSRRTSRHRKVTALVSKAFDAARSMVFMPLYDNETQKVYAAFFGWTSSSHRVLVENEFVYIAGFTHSIMYEVMRLETLTLEKAKSEFMSSMSHELRSPLHGILAATQLVQESDLTSAQRELAVMVDSCGRTLLDIIYNLLEHAKINNMLPDKRLSRRQRPAKSRRKSPSANQPGRPGSEAREVIDVAAILEETVTAVAAGHSIKEQRLAQLAARRDSDLARSAKGKNTDDDKADKLTPPCVIIDVAYRSRWLFTTDAGSWRRIIMNLVGNALKYTDRGFVKIELWANDLERAGKSISQSQLTLVVSDSGHGISEHYLKHRLFTPFQQEDNLAVGVGLGLSIVNRLVNSMRGRIKVESKVNVGTTVTVTVPLKFPDQRPTLHRMNSSDTFASVRKLCSRNEKLCFVGFDVASNDISNSTEDDKLNASTLLQLKRSMVELVQSWFSLTITEDFDTATLFVVERMHALSLMKSDPDNNIFKTKYVVVTAYDNANIEKNQWTGRFYSLTVPIGPTKFARMLKTALQQEGSPPPHPSEPPTAEPPRNSASSDGTGEEQQGSGRSKAERTDHDVKKRKTTSTESAAADELDLDRRLLLVDDNNINLRILENLVRKLKLPFISAKDGQEALNEYINSHERGEPIRYVFMDISMPVMDGITSTKHIRSYEQKNQIEPPSQIIVLTGLGREETRRDAEACGADEYFTKPVKLDVLRGILHKDGEQ